MQISLWGWCGQTQRVTMNKATAHRPGKIMSHVRAAILDFLGILLMMQEVVNKALYSPNSR